MIFITRSFIGLAILVLALTLILFALRIYRTFKTLEHIYLEVVPPIENQKSLHATQELTKLLHAVLNRYSLQDVFHPTKQTISLEIVSTRELGIRYLIVAHPSQEKHIKHLLHAYSPEMEIHKTQDYASQLNTKKHVSVTQFKQTNHRQRLIGS